jgi:hypothetical protein
VALEGDGCEGGDGDAAALQYCPDGTLCVVFPSEPGGNPGPGGFVIGPIVLTVPQGTGGNLGPVLDWIIDKFKKIGRWLFGGYGIGTPSAWGAPPVGEEVEFGNRPPGPTRRDPQVGTEGPAGVPPAGSESPLIPPGPPSPDSGPGAPGPGPAAPAGPETVPPKTPSRGTMARNAGFSRGASAFVCRFDYAQFSLAFTLPKTGGLVSLGGHASLDRYGRAYFGVGPSLGLSTPPSVSLTGGALARSTFVATTGGIQRVAYNTDAASMTSFMTGHSISWTTGAGFVWGRAIASGRLADEVGVGTPQIGGTYHYSWQARNTPIQWGECR